MQPITVRPASWPDDLAALARLDTSFHTDVVYRPVLTDTSLQLVETPIAPALTKRYHLDFDERDSWHCALVAESEGAINGFAAAEYATWNRRMVLQHLYVDPSCRGRGVGTLLLQAVDTAARATPARCLWLETQNINLPGIRFYRRCGFRFCGFDASLYLPGAEEFALFFVRPLTNESAAPGA